MRLFGTRKIADRFPIARICFLPGVICASIMSEAERVGSDKSQAISSKFACAYMLGYPHYVDQFDQDYGAKIRQLIFDEIFGPESGRDLFVQSMRLLLAQDDQARSGWGCGAADGERYFKALEHGKDASDSSTSLILFANTPLADFETQVR